MNASCAAPTSDLTLATVPHSPARLVRWLTRAAHWLDERERRGRIVRLLDYDDRMLDDMGLTRLAIEDALDLPLSVNALDWLHGRPTRTARRA